MNINRYIFDSPYPNQVQIGRPDPSMKEDVSTGQTNPQLPKNTNETAIKVEDFSGVQKQDVKSTVNSNNLLDVYA